MSLIISEEDTLSTRDPEEVESPRKRMRLDNSARKGWSLMDRKTDQEVFQEMGVSLLEPDGTEGFCDGNLLHKKRKHNQENVNPNIYSSPKRSPRSPKNRISPGAGPSNARSPTKARSPRSADKSKPLQPTDSNTLESTLPLVPSCPDEETPLGQSVAGCLTAHVHATALKARSLTPASKPETVVSRRTPTTGPDAFASLSDEMLLSVFRWLPKRALAHCMLVCKRWHRVACDETLWQRLDLGNKTIAKDALGRILARKPSIIRLANSEIGEWHTNMPPTPSRVQYLDLSICTVDRLTLNNLLIRCPLLKKLSLEAVPLDDTTCHIIGKCSSLETLNLTMAQGITAAGLTSILEGCPNIQSLNISWCSLSEAALEVLVEKLPVILLRLNVGGARIMTDYMVSQLVSRCPFLRELDLSDCSRVGASAVTRVMSLKRLEHLALSRCYLLPPHVLTKLNSMPSLQYLEVWGMLQANSLKALKAALPAIQINQFMFSAIARPTVGSRRTSIWGLRTRD